MNTCPVAIRAKATGTPRKNSANSRISPMTPTATLDMPGILCVASHHMNITPATEAVTARAAWVRPVRRAASASRVRNWCSKATASRQNPKPAK